MANDDAAYLLIYEGHDVIKNHELRAQDVAYLEPRHGIWIWRELTDEIWCELSSEIVLYEPAKSRLNSKDLMQLNSDQILEKVEDGKWEIVK